MSYTLTGNLRDKKKKEKLSRVFLPGIHPHVRVLHVHSRIYIQRWTPG